MKINFPQRGDVLYAGGTGQRTHFVTAPLQARFLIESEKAFAIGQPFKLSDEAGTTLTYLLETFTDISFVYGVRKAFGTGKLIGVDHTEQNVIPMSDHEARVSTMIDQAFEAGRQVAHQERDEEIKAIADDLVLVLDEPANAFVRFADGSNSMFLDVCSILNVDGELSLETTVGSFIDVHPSWRSYELLPIVDEVDEDDDDVELINPLSVASEGLFEITKGPAEDCGCEACAAVAAEEHAKAVWGGIWADKSVDLSSKVPAGTTLLWKPRFGPIGNRIDDE
jgi:hypothetical protein